ncbi:MAG: cadherin repeat domain-containing protein [Planctomycetia bacterium]|nr:cadherin repeat domain-containing protein [Planctomycetia bacterium]
MTDSEGYVMLHLSRISRKSSRTTNITEHRTLRVEDLEARMLLSVSNCPGCDELQTAISDDHSSTSASVIDVSAVLASAEDDCGTVSVTNFNENFSPIDQATRDAFDLMWEQMAVCSAELDADEEVEWLDNSSFEVTPLSLGETLDDSEADGDLNPVAMTSSGGDSSGGSGGSSSGGSGGSSSGGSGGTSSGGTGNSGGSGGSGGTGGSGGNVINTTLSGGVSFVEGDTVYLWTSGACPGDVVTITLSGAASSVDDIDYLYCVLQCTVGASGQAMFQIRTINDGLNENNESLTIHFNVTSSSNSVIDPHGASYTITLYDKPEFKSDISNNSQQDFYRSYIKVEAALNDPLNFRTQIQAPSANVKYQFADDFDYANYFKIDADTGEISLRMTAEAILIDSLETYTFSFDILAYNANMPDAIDNYCYDVATVRITLSHWTINRNNQQDIASATPSDGCSIESLAATAGLKLNEYTSWLTIASGSENAQIELFDGTTKTVSSLLSSDVLSENYSSIFSVPNTIFAAYCYDPDELDTFGYYLNLTALESLGFSVVTFDNYQYNFYDATLAKHDFINQIQYLSAQKYLHGMYFISHGVIPTDNSNNAIGIQAGSNNPLDILWGPRWTIYYSAPSSSFGSGNNPNNDSQWGIAQVLSYHLGAVVAHSCYAGSNAASLGHDNGIFSGQDGPVTVAYWHIESKWHVGYWINLNHFGGLQGTR